MWVYYWQSAESLPRLKTVSAGAQQWQVETITALWLLTGVLSESRVKETALSRQSVQGRMLLTCCSLNVLHKSQTVCLCWRFRINAKLQSKEASLPKHQSVLALNYKTSTTFSTQRWQLNMEEQKRVETQIRKEVGKKKKVLPVHNRERYTQKVCRPPFLQRACNKTVREEKKRTLQQAFMDLRAGKSRKQQNRDAAACRLQSEQEAERYSKITLARRKTCTEAARRSFPGDISFTHRGFWLANEELLTVRSDSHRLHKHGSLPCYLLLKLA